MPTRRALTIFMGLLFSGLQFTLAQGRWVTNTTRGFLWNASGEIVSQKYSGLLTKTHLKVECELQLKPGIFWSSLSEEQSRTLEMVTDFSLPSEAVVTGALIWNGSQILQAKLKSSTEARKQYEEVVDRNVIRVQPRDPILLEQTGKDRFRFSVYPFRVGEVRKIRYQYLIPVKNINSIPTVLLPFFETSGSGPITIESKEEEAIYIPNVGIRRLPTNVSFYPSRWDLAPSFQLIQDPNSAIQSTLNHNGVQGHILDLKARIPDSLMRLGKGWKEFIILWRWNDPATLRNYSSEIYSQAENIKSFIAGLHPYWHKVALILDPGSGNFKSSKLSSGEKLYQSAVFPDSTQQTLPWDSMENLIAWPTNNDSTKLKLIAEEGLNRFQNALQLSTGIFSSDTLTKKYILIVTAGNPLVSKKSVAVQSLLPEGLNVKFLGMGRGPTEQTKEYYRNPKPFTECTWPGVDVVGAIQADQFSIKKIIGGTVGIPYDWPLKVWVEFKNPLSKLKLLAVDPLVNQEWASAWSSFRVHSHQGPWAPILRWSIGDGDKEVASVETSIKIQPSLDSVGLALLWGSGPYAASTQYDMSKTLATKLGFVDAIYSLLALEQDVMDIKLQDLYQQSGLPWLSAKEIFIDAKAPIHRTEAPKNSQTEYEAWTDASGLPLSLNPHSFTHFLEWKVSKEFLELSFKPGVDLKTLVLLLMDANGKKLGKWDGKEVVNGRLNIKTWSSLKSGVYYLQLRNSQKVFSQKIVK